MCNRLGVCQRFIGNFFFFAHLAPSLRSNHQSTLLVFYSMTPPCFYPLLRAAFLISVQWLPHFSYCCIKAANTKCMHSLADQKILRTSTYVWIWKQKSDSDIDAFKWNYSMLQVLFEFSAALVIVIW